MTEDRETAEMGSVLPFTVAALHLMQNLLRGRDDALSRLLGRTYKRSPLRDDLMRSAVLRLSEGKISRVSEYQTEMARYGSRSLIRTELDLLVGAGLVILNHDPRSERSTQVWPTRRLVSFYNKQMPALVEEVRNAVSSEALCQLP